jgi:secondary thiamine-phosphate synthase enzyme
MIRLLTVSTNSKVEFQNITRAVQETVDSIRVESGICYLSIPHTTAAIILADQSDPNIIGDIASQLEVIVPQHGNYQHIEGNSPAHIKASLCGNSAILSIEGSALVLGMWQGIFLCEFDGPKIRNVYVKIVPDSR